MRVVTATQLRAKLGEILDAASAGEKILIERDHKPLAYLISPEEEAARDAIDREERIARQLRALDELVEFGKEMRRKYPLKPGDLSAAEWVRWDRDHRDEEKRKRDIRFTRDTDEHE
jgi:prevent-host-death family protein